MFEHKLSYIEIWENTEELSTTNYERTLLNSSDDHQFDWSGYIFRINHNECENLALPENP